VDAALQVEAEPQLARRFRRAVGRPGRDTAREQEGAVEGRADPQLLAHEGVGEARQGRRQHEPEDEGVLEASRHLYFFSVSMG